MLLSRKLYLACLNFGQPGGGDGGGEGGGWLALRCPKGSTLHIQKFMSFRPSRLCLIHKIGA